MDNQQSEFWELAYVSATGLQGDQEPKTHIRGLERIDIDLFGADNRAVSNYRDSMNLVQSVWLNVQDFTKSVVLYSSQFLQTKSLDPSQLDEIALNFSLQLLNTLSMFRSLLDHSNTALSRDFGKDSKQLCTWERAKSDHYDSSFEYRFFFKLRNYAQHVRMPPLGISFSASAGEKAISFRLDFVRDALLEERESWNKQLISDLMSRPERIPVFECLDNWSRAFWSISKVLLDLRRFAAMESAERILSYRRRFDLPEDSGRLCAFRVLDDDRATKSVNFRLRDLQERWAQEVVNGPDFSPESTDA